MVSCGQEPVGKNNFLNLAPRSLPQLRHATHLIKEQVKNLIIFSHKLKKTFSLGEVITDKSLREELAQSDLSDLYGLHPNQVVEILSVHKSKESFSLEEFIKKLATDKSFREELAQSDLSNAYVFYLDTKGILKDIELDPDIIREISLEDILADVNLGKMSFKVFNKEFKLGDDFADIFPEFDHDIKRQRLLSDYEDVIILGYLL